MTTDETKTKKEDGQAQEGAVKTGDAPKTSPKSSAPAKKRSSRGAPRGRDNRGRGGRDRKRGPRREREKPEFEQKITGIRRVTRVAAGGRRFSFSVSVVIGDRNGRVGVGVGKAGDTALAIEKAIRDARANMITVKRTKENSIPHEIDAKYCGSVVTMTPSPGKGLVAGSSVRNVLDLAGVTDVSAKILSRSKNKLNNAHAALLALQSIA